MACAGVDARGGISGLIEGRMGEDGVRVGEGRMGEGWGRDGGDGGGAGEGGNGEERDGP